MIHTIVNEKIQVATEETTAGEKQQQDAGDAASAVNETTEGERISLSYCCSEWRVMILQKVKEFSYLSVHSVKQ